MNKQENNNEGFADLFKGISRQKKRIEESSLTQGVHEVITEINTEALEGKGSFSGGLGQSPADTKFTLEWEGTITKKQELRREGEPFVMLVNPFNISINIFTNEDGFSGFRITAKYLPDSEPVEVGRTGKLDVKQLQPILKTQISAIKQSAKR